MRVNTWKRKARALARLAEDQRGKPEGDLAREKLLEIIAKHPEARNYQPIVDLAQRDMSCADFLEMKRMGVSTDGSWTAPTIEEAIAVMVADYRQRLLSARRARFAQVVLELEVGVSA